MYEVACVCVHGAANRFNLHQLRFQRINARCVAVVALIRRVFIRLVAKMSDLFYSNSERMQDTLVQCSPRLMG